MGDPNSDALAWCLGFIYHFSNQGPEVTLITYNAEGIEAVKRKLKVAALILAL